MIVGDSEEMKAVWFTVERKEAMAWKQHEARTCHVKHEVCRLYTRRSAVRLRSTAISISPKVHRLFVVVSEM